MVRWRDGNTDGDYDDTKDNTDRTLYCLNDANATLPAGGGQVQRDGRPPAHDSRSAARRDSWVAKLELPLADACAPSPRPCEPA